MLQTSLLINLKEKKQKNTKKIFSNLNFIIQDTPEKFITSLTPNKIMHSFSDGISKNQFLGIHPNEGNSQLSTDSLELTNADEIIPIEPSHISTN